MTEERYHLFVDSNLKISFKKTLSIPLKKREMEEQRVLKALKEVFKFNTFKSALQKEAVLKICQGK